ncbi:hypothetical protein BDF14DRAFT_1776288 [Spinellus fusiger]|nr:hypothetical protein BDF14DRAFT_1776288 [Spinellus fusiger]
MLLLKCSLSWIIRKGIYRAKSVMYLWVVANECCSLSMAEWLFLHQSVCSICQCILCKKYMAINNNNNKEQ